MPLAEANQSFIDIQYFSRLLFTPTQYSNIHTTVIHYATKEKECKGHLPVPLVGCACLADDPVPTALPATSRVINQYTCISAYIRHCTHFKSSYVHNAASAASRNLPQNTQFGTQYFNRIPFQTLMQILRKIPMHFSIDFQFNTQNLPL